MVTDLGREKEFKKNFIFELGGNHNISSSSVMKMGLFITCASESEEVMYTYYRHCPCFRARLLKVRVTRGGMC